jgi:NTE family protein
MTSLVDRPKIGLALGGGVARGWAHIGALRALLKAGYNPDIICGTSMGALVGGFYLAGHLNELEEWALALNKRRMISYLDVVTGGTGLIAGNRLEKLIREYINGVTIEDLDRPFAAVTTELATGHEIWLQEGALVDAIRASYALPGVFTPVRLNNRWLIDGALVNPVPVSVCRALGARLVIGVTLNYDAFGKSNAQARGAVQELDRGGFTDDRYNNVVRKNKKASPQRTMMRQLFGNGQNAPGVGSVMLSSLNIIMDRLSRARMAGDPPDVLISPRVGHVSLLEFNRAADLIKLGEEAVEEMLPYIDEAMAILSH